MTLVRISKECLHDMREIGWDGLMADVSSFCLKYEIVEVRMDDIYVPIGRVKRGKQNTNSHYYQHDLFHECIYRQLAELDNCFDEVNTELLLCMASLNPSNAFAAFNKEKLVRLAEFYTYDFSEVERVIIQNQLDMKSNADFLGLKGIGDLAMKMVEKGKNDVYILLYKLIKLCLILPVATATVERAFSAMNIVNDCLVTYIEKDIFKSIENETIMNRFQQMRPCRGQL